MYDAKTLTINHMLENCREAIILAHKLLTFVLFSSISFIHVPQSQKVDCLKDGRRLSETR